MKNNINIVEVGLRDGLQNEKKIIPTDIKIAFLHKLIASQLSTIEVTSLVSPRWVPQMADSEQVIAQLPQNTHCHFPVLVPNQKGLDTALRLGVKDIAVFGAASETFSQKNINRSLDQSLADFTQITQLAIQSGIRVRGYVSCVLGCPYEGKVALSQVVKMAKGLIAAGCMEVSLGDTIGVGTPLAAQQMVKAVMSEIPVSQLALHFHDTYGQALANIFACLELGITTIDSSVAGLGGCPYAVSATGNVATEEVIYLLEGMGLHTGVDLDQLIQAGEYICQHLGSPNRSKVAVALTKKSKGE